MELFKDSSWGRILFNIFMNDLGTKHRMLLKSADDTNLGDVPYGKNWMALKTRETEMR